MSADARLIGLDARAESGVSLVYVNTRPELDAIGLSLTSLSHLHLRQRLWAAQ